MTVEQLISPSVAVLLPYDTGNYAFDVMDEHHFAQLPIVSEDNYLALIQESDIYDWEKPESKLSSAGFLGYKPAIGSIGHPFDAIKIMHQMNLSVLPVIDNDHRYIGALTRDSLFKYITENSGIDTPGGIIVIEIAPRNYTLYEIARICENEDVTITNLQVHTNEKGMLEVTMKLNRTSIDAVVSSLERHEYHVKEVFGEEAYNQDIESKYNHLMNYINM